MSSPRIGSLFSGYGGLDMGVMAALGGSVAWHVEFDKAPSKILAHHWPDVPNYGDVTAVDWSTVEPVDIITGGSPCQDLSHAGKRAGMTEGTRSNLWVAMREAIAQLRPGLVVWENVRGAYSAPADSEVEPCAGCVGDRPGVSLRALGRVLGDLSDLGYDCRWHGLRAADVGAPHGRFRVFVVASDANMRAGHGEWARTELGQGGATTADARRGGWDGRAQDSLRRPLGGVATAGSGALLPTPRTSDTNGAGEHGQGGVDLRTAISLLPTPRSTRGDSNTETRNLLPTPMVGSTSPASHGQISGDYRAKMAEALQNWGQYADAIARWEALTRPAPPPTQPSKKGTPQLSPAFSEWLMGLPDGHVTGIPGLSRNDMLKALGNGVVPAQAAAALRFLLGVREVAA